MFDTGEAETTCTAVSVDAIDARGAVLTRIRRALIDVRLTIGA